MMIINQDQILDREIFKNPIFSDKAKLFIKLLLREVRIEDVFFGDPQGYCGYKMLVIEADADKTTGLKIEGKSDYYYVKGTFYVECCLDTDDGGDIQISNCECEPVGYIALE